MGRRFRKKTKSLVWGILHLRSPWDIQVQQYLWVFVGICLELRRES